MNSARLSKLASSSRVAHLPRLTHSDCSNMSAYEKASNSPTNSELEQRQSSTILHLYSDDRLKLKYSSSIALLVQIWNITDLLFKRV